jgi:hypothetical protein
MEWLVRFFNLLDPHVKGIEFILNKVIEIVRSVENTVDRSHQEREESKTKELKDDGENVLLGGGSGIISISDSGNNFKNPIEGKDVLSVV